MVANVTPMRRLPHEQCTCASSCAAGAAQTSSLEAATNQPGQQLSRQSYSSFLGACGQSGDCPASWLHASMGANHHPSVQQRRDGRNCLVSVLSRPKRPEELHRGHHRADCRGCPLASETVDRNDPMVSGQIASILGRTRAPGQDQPGVAATIASPLWDPLAADEDLEGIDRPRVLAEISADPKTLRRTPARRSALVCGRIRSLEPPATTRPLPGGAK